MAKPDPNKDGGGSMLSALALVGQLGLVVAIPIVLGVLFGNYLDKLAGAHGLVLIGMVLLGIVAAAYSAYRVLKQVLDWKQ